MAIAPGGHVQKSRPTQNKRMRERARQEKQQMKAARRQEARVRKANTPSSASDEDPDIAGIVPGPQPSPWGDELEDFLATDEDVDEGDGDEPAGADAKSGKTGE